MTHRRAAALALLLAASPALLASGCSARAAALRPSGPPVKGGLLDLSGRPLLLESLRGKVLLVDFFATWCEPCQKGLARSQALVERLAPKGLAGLAVSLDDRLELVQPFTERLGLRLQATWDDHGQLADELGVEQLPTVALLDRTGALRFLLAGASDQGAEEIDRAAALLLRER
jgi:thiol-disulfide isomerase/thioredoxin